MSDDERWEAMREIILRMAIRNQEMQRELQELRLLIATHFFPEGYQTETGSSDD